MAEKHTPEYICEVGGGNDLLIDTVDPYSKYQTKTMKSQPPGNYAATCIFKCMSGLNDLEGFTLMPETQLDVTVSQLLPAELLEGAQLW